MAFTKAVKRDAKLRLAVSGPAGSGKTFTLLKLASELGGRIAFVDTEHGSASKYAHTPACAADCKDPSHFIFDVLEPSSFDPRTLIESIAEAVKEGYSVFCCDSLSHYWMGPDGELELVDNAAKQMRNPNGFTAWKTVTPIHNKLVDTMLSSPIHILVSMRTKTEWVIEKDEKTGKQIPRKIGLQPVMRDGIEFEFDVCGDMDQDNTLIVTKSRCSALSGKSINRPGREMAQALKAWLGTAGPLPEKGGSGEQEQGGSGPAHTAAPAVQAEAAALSEDVPKQLQHIFASLTRAGAVREAFELMKAQLQSAMPRYGETEYKRLLEKHTIKPGSGNNVSAVKAALLDMWQLAEFAKQQKAQQSEPYQATDADLLAGLFPENETQEAYGTD